MSNCCKVAPGHVVPKVIPKRRDCKEKRRGLEGIAEVGQEGLARALDVDQLEELKKVSVLAPRTISSLAPDDWLAPTFATDCGP